MYNEGESMDMNYRIKLLMRESRSKGTGEGVVDEMVVEDISEESREDVSLL